MRSLDEFEKKIGYKFKNRNLLITALTHSSYANESRGGDQSYERLEFLGDSILGFVTADWRKPSALYCTTLNRRRSLRANARLKTTRRCCRRSFSRTPVNGSNTSLPASMAPTMTSTSP